MMFLSSSIFLFCPLLVSSDLQQRHIVFDDPDYGSVERLYLQYLPSNYDSGDMFPLVLDFHGFTMTADDQRQYSQWDVLAEEEGFIAVFPEGVPDSPSELRSILYFIKKRKNYIFQ